MPTEASNRAAAAKNIINNVFMRVRAVDSAATYSNPRMRATGKPQLPTRSSFWIAFRSIVGLAWMRIIQATGKSGRLSAFTPSGSCAAGHT